MINPINNNLPNEYQNARNRVNPTDSGEQFSLKSALEKDAAGEGVIYEPSGEKSGDKKTSSADKKSNSFADSLGNAVENKAKEEPSEDQITSTANMIWENIKDFFVSLWKNVRKIFGNLWDSKPIADGLEKMSPDNAKEKTGDFDKNISPSGTEAVADSTLSSIESLETARDESIKKALKEGDKERFKSLISEEGKKYPARNTDMLTTYNSRGRINEISASDQNKILRGDRGARKL
ncbi:MAG: hypothetical protein K5669_03185 [Lachnospiraceae bacterium]|nr:hypothetical protein [Lachnospiraceae bacterium]